MPHRGHQEETERAFLNFFLEELEIITNFDVRQNATAGLAEDWCDSQEAWVLNPKHQVLSPRLRLV